MSNQENWQWCDICYGFTIHKDEKCTQCGNGTRNFTVVYGNMQITTVVDRETLQRRAEYEINYN